MANANDRCEFCFRYRMESTAKIACEKDLTHYTTTLLISPYQKQQLLIDVGNEMGNKYGVEFFSDVKHLEISEMLRQHCDELAKTLTRI